LDHENIGIAFDKQDIDQGDFGVKYCRWIKDFQLKFGWQLPWTRLEIPLPLEYPRGQGDKLTIPKTLKFQKPLSKG